MTGSSIGKQEQDRSEREKLENELKTILKASTYKGILMRVIGSLAFQMHCPQFGYLQQAMGRAYTDIDFAVYNAQARQIQSLLLSMGYVENRELYIATEGERAIFDKPGTGLHMDIFYEKLDFCHTIYWKDRLEVDSPTIPLTELLLEKMQIVKINEKDVIDTIMLLLEHPWVTRTTKPPGGSWMPTPVGLSLKTTWRPCSRRSSRHANQPNAGSASLSSDVLIEKETSIPSVLKFAVSRGADYAVIGPEAPLEAGIVDRLEERGIPCVGPTLKAALLETDKAFCREMMQRHGISGCPHYRTFYRAGDAVDFIRDYEGDLAIKPIGLRGGKGVRIMGEHLDREGAVAYIRSLGGNVVLEERLVGEEFTLQAFVDGKHIVPMPLVQDHKRAFEGDQGPNTGGMGAYSMPDHSLPFVTETDRQHAFGIMKEVVRVMEDAGTPYRGVLYGQFMNTAKGPMVIEFNARFGDPEAMNVLSVLESDLQHCHQNRIGFAIRK